MSRGHSGVEAWGEGSPALAETTQDGLDGKPRQIGPKEGNRVYNPTCLGTQNGNPGPDEFLTIIIPGTNWKKEDWNENCAFYKQVMKTFGEKPVILDWSGGNPKKASAEAAAKLCDLIKNHKFADGEKLNVVAHSHAGNVAFLGSNSTSHNFDNLLTLGTIVRLQVRIRLGLSPHTRTRRPRPDDGKIFRED